ncbi:MAG: hypothetical protein HY205_02955 [Nitrospirae bacterium]|nr:hypothetical protein [Nitrospirota bacterium]
MPKIITAKRLEGESDMAREYVKTHILFPSGLLGLIFLVSGTGSLIYQFMFEDYSWRTFVESTALLMAGGLLGWGQTRYHQYLLRDYPGYFAGRLRMFSRSGQKRSKRELPVPDLQHPGRNLVPFYYAAGAAGLLGAAALSAVFGQVYYMAAFLMPWAGFFWAKMYFWRDLMLQSRH